MADFTSMVSRVQSLVGNHSLATSAVVGGFVNSRHRNLLESYDWSRRKRDILISTAVDKTAGTVTVTNASSTLTGSSTAWAATDVDRSIKIGTNSYSIWTVNAYTSATSITLGDRNGNVVTYPGDTAAAQAYTMFTQFYELGAGIEQIVNIKYKGEIREVSEEFLDNMDPGRQGTGDPRFFARSARKMTGANDIVRIELYPRLTEAVAINVKVELGHTTLSGTSNPIVPSGPCEWFAAVDTCFFLKAKTKDDTWLSLADKYSAEGERSREFELGQDAKKFGVQQQVRDSAGDINPGLTDLGLDHDFGL